MSDQSSTPTNKPESKADAAPTKKVKIRLGDDKPITVEKPSPEYTQYVFGHGYKEV